MKVAFYIAEYGNFYDKLISIWTGSIFSHCELIFSDGEAFSASPMFKGTRFICSKKFNKKHWIFLDLDISMDQENEIRYKSTQLLYTKYDWVGIFLSQVLPFKIQDEQKWWCSEICAYLLGLKNKNLSPKQLLLELNRNKLLKKD